MQSVTHKLSYPCSVPYKSHKFCLGRHKHAFSKIKVTSTLSFTTNNRKPVELLAHNTAFETTNAVLVVLIRDIKA